VGEFMKKLAADGYHWSMMYDSGMGLIAGATKAYGKEHPDAPLPGGGFVILSDEYSDGKTVMHELWHVDGYNNSTKKGDSWKDATREQNLADANGDPKAFAEGIMNACPKCKDKCTW